jgi:hypothetical protein
MDRDNTTNGKQPEQSSTGSEETNVEFTILVAMPQPPFQPDQLRPPSLTNQHKLGSSSSLRSIDLRNHVQEEFTFSDLPHYTPTSADLDSEELPYVEVGTTVVPLNIRNSEDRETMQDLRLGKMGSRAGIAGDWGRTDTTGTGR